MSQVVAVEPTPVEYPNDLASKEPQRRALPTARWNRGERDSPIFADTKIGTVPRWAPFLLLLLCLAPRAAMTLRIPGVCPDGVSISGWRRP